MVFTLGFSIVSEFDFFYEVIPNLVEEGKEREVTIESEVASGQFSLALPLENGCSSLVGEFLCST